MQPRSGRALAGVAAAIALIATGGGVSAAYADDKAQPTAPSSGLKAAGAKTDRAASAVKRGRRLLADAASGTPQQISDAMDTLGQAETAFNAAAREETDLDPQVVAAHAKDSDATGAYLGDMHNQAKIDAMSQAQKASEQARESASSATWSRVGLDKTRFTLPMGKKPLRDKLKTLRHDMAQAQVTLKTTQALSPNDTAAIDAAKEQLGLAAEHFYGAVSYYIGQYAEDGSFDHYMTMQVMEAKTDEERKAASEALRKYEAEVRERQRGELIKELDTEERAQNEPPPSQPKSGDKGDTSAPESGSVLGGDVLSGAVLQGIGVTATPLAQPNRRAGDDDSGASQSGGSKPSSP